MKTNQLILVFLLFLSYHSVFGQETNQNQDNSQDNVKDLTQHFIFRTDQAGFEVVQQQFTHTFLIFYKGEDLEEKFEQNLEDFIKQNYSQNKVYLAISYEDNKQFANKLNVHLENNDQEQQVVLYRNGVQINYQGEFDFDNKESGEFQNWFKEQAVAHIYHLQNQEDLHTLLQTYEENSVVFYQGENKGLDQIKSHVEADIFSQNDVQKVYYYDVPEQNKNSTLILLKSTPYEEDKVFLYSDELDDSNSLVEFLRISTLKALNYLTDETYVKIFGSPISTQILLFLSEDQQKNEIALQTFKEAALHNINDQMSYERSIFAIVENVKEHKELYDLFMLEQQKLPQIVVTKTEYSQFKFEKYKYSDVYDTINKDNIIQYLEDVRLKKVEPYLQSEDIPQYNEKQQIRQIVGKNFREEVIRQRINYLVLFWDSKDPISAVKFQKLIDQLLEEYGDRLENLLKIGKFDLHKNESEFVQLESAPQLVIYPKQDKTKPVQFDADVYSFDMFKLFLKQWVQNIDLEERLQLGKSEPDEKIEL